MLVLERREQAAGEAQSYLDEAVLVVVDGRSDELWRRLAAAGAGRRRQRGRGARLPSIGRRFLQRIKQGTDFGDARLSLLPTLRCERMGIERYVDRANACGRDTGAGTSQFGHDPSGENPIVRSAQNL